MVESLAEGTLIVVATGAEARMFRWSHSHGGLLKHTGGLQPENLDGEGPSGMRPPESSKQSTDEATFAKQLSNYLYSEAYKGSFEHVALIADPRTLGEMRPQLHKEVTDRIVAEIPKTMIHSPTDDIVHALKDHVA